MTHHKNTQHIRTFLAVTGKVKNFDTVVTT